MSAVTDLAGRARFYERFTRTYWRESAGLPPLRRARDIAGGYHPHEADWYRQRRGHARGCTTNFDREHHLKLMNRHYGYVLDDKAVFCAMAARRDLPVPPVCARAVGGVWRWEAGGEAALDASLAEHGRFVVKPTLGKKGQEVALLASLGVMTPAPAFDAIATPFVQQHPYSGRIFPGALNTIRVLMLRDEAGPFAAAATHRFGTARSGVTDNFSRDGLVAGLDLASGVMAEGLTVGPGNALMTHARHPDTDARIEGEAVPGWNDVTRLVGELGEAFPELIYVGWDIAMTEDGPVVIEGNSHPSMRFFQLYEEVLRTPRLAAFFADYLPVDRRVRP